MHILSDPNRVKVMQDYPYILSKHSGKCCIVEAANFLTEKQKAIIDVKVKECKTKIIKNQSNSKK